MMAALSYSPGRMMRASVRLPTLPFPRWMSGRGGMCCASCNLIWHLFLCRLVSKREQVGIEWKHCVMVEESLHIPSC